MRTTIYLHSLLLILCLQIPFILIGQNVGINTTSPTEKLDVNGKMRMRSGATDGYWLESDANGAGTWKKPRFKQITEEVEYPTQVYKADFS